MFVPFRYLLQHANVAFAPLTLYVTGMTGRDYSGPILTPGTALGSDLTDTHNYVNLLYGP